MGRYIDRTGQRFGMMLVLHRMPPPHTDRVMCRCDCGNEKDVKLGNLVTGQTTSCGCLHRTRVLRAETPGTRYGRLVVVGRFASDTNGTATWTCRCDCGNEVVVLGRHLRSGNTKSCGCQRIDSAKVTNRTHGMAGTLAYKRWESIKQRCTNPRNPSYPNYGGRGISICPEWAESFDAFHAAVGDPPSPAHSLDRIDNDGDYEPGNVRWATRSEQQQNRRPYPPMIERAIRVLTAAGWTLTPPPGDKSDEAMPDSSAS